MAAAAVNPGSRDSSYFSTGENRAYVSKDGHTMFAEIYPPKNAPPSARRCTSTRCGRS